MPLQIRRGLQSEATLLASPPLEGELIYVTDTEQLYVGDGTTLLKDLTPVTGYTDEDAADHIADLLTTGPNTGITFTYNDLAGTITTTINPTQTFTTLTVSGSTSLASATVSGNLTVEGKLDADFQGSISADDSTILVDAVDGTINLNGTINDHIIPIDSEAVDLGSAAKKFRDLYLSGTSLYLGNAQVTASGAAINLPAGSTVGGNAIQSAVSEDTAFIRDIQGSVFGDDSTLLVDAVSSTVRLDNGQIFINGSTIEVGGGASQLQIGNLSDALSIETVFTSVDGTAPMVGLVKGASSFGDMAKVTIRSRHGADIENPSAITQGDYVGGFAAAAYDPDGSVEDYIPTTIVASRIDNQETVSAGTAKGKLVLSTNGGTYASPSFNYCTFDAQGRLAVNQMDAAATLDVNGFAKLAVLTAAPSSLANGMIAIADGTSWDPSGGATPGKQQAVVYLGGGWRAMAVEP